LVLDASLPPDIYVAQQRGWRITQVIDTHIHANHLSRSRLLAEMTNATLGVPLVTTLQAVQARVSRLQLAETESVNWLLAHLPPTPPNHSRIVALNEAGGWPDGDVTIWKRASTAAR
jgi:glyoxylase-like metal-dependent hydrolase (beta-lactamase superfamily II)